MYMTIDGKPVSLNRHQAELIWQAWETRMLEEKAARMLERFSDDFFDDSLSLWLDASQDRDHLDYICDMLAQQFLLHRNDNEADVNVWHRVIRRELDLRANVPLDAGCFSGSWLQRPIENLARLCWRNRFGKFSAVFTTDETLTDSPSSLFTLTLTRQPDGALQVTLQDACSDSTSDMRYFPDADGQPQCDCDELEKSLREYLEVYAQMRNMTLPELLWIQQF